MKDKQFTSLLAIFAAHAMHTLPFRKVVEKQGPEVRPCLLCGTPKQHNNSFCSAKCCRLWKEGHREVPEVHNTNED